MRIIKKIPWKALTILAIGFVIGFGTGAKTGHKVTWLTTAKTLEKTGVAEKVNKPTVTNDISNEINIEKIKKSDTLNIVLDPTNNQKPVNIISDKECLKEVMSALSVSRQKRLQRWLQ
nr:hypothetical protein [Allomuricauda sp.]